MSERKESADGDQPTSAQQRLIQGYERMAEKAREYYAQAEKRTGPWLEDAIDKAKQALEDAGEYTREETAELREYLKRDLAATREDMDRLRGRIPTQLEPSRLGAGFLNLVATASEGAADVFASLASRVGKQLTYRTGEMTGPGTLICTECAKELHYEKPGHIPPCPGCRGGQFRKRY